MKISFNEIEQHLNDSKKDKINTTVNGVCEKCNKPFTVNFYSIFRKGNFKEICFKCKLSEIRKIDRWEDIYISTEKDVQELLERINNCNNPTAWRTTRVFFNCTSCGKGRSSQLRSFIKNRSLVCSFCKGIHTNEKKYGYKTAFCKDEVQLKAQQAQIEKYGGIGLASQCLKDKIQKTNLEKYGSENPLGRGTEPYNKRNKTVKEKYKVDNVFQIPDVKEKIAKTNLEKYGSENPFSSDIIKNKIVETNLEKYGVEYFTQTTDFAKYHRSTYTYNNINFDSSWELIFYIYHTDHNNKIIRCNHRLEYIYKKKKHYYFPDFVVNGQMYEVKGEQFWKKDGTMQNPYDHSQDELFETKHQCGLRNNVIFIRKKDIEPMINYVISKYSVKYLATFRN